MSWGLGVRDVLSIAASGGGAVAIVGGCRGTKGAWVDRASQPKNVPIR